MLTISTTYDCKYQVKGMNEYKFAKKKLFNTQNKNNITYNGCSLPYKQNYYFIN